MGAKSRSADTVELDNSDRMILDELEKGRCTPGALADWTGLSRSTVHYHLKMLRAGDYVKQVHDSGLYELNSTMKEGDSSEA